MIFSVFENEFSTLIFLNYDFSLKILKYRRTYGDPVKENDVASSQEQEDSKIQIAVSMENLEYLDIVTEDREVMKIYLSWMELKQQEDPQSILNKIKTAGKQCYLMLLFLVS